MFRTVLAASVAVSATALAGNAVAAPAPLTAFVETKLVRVDSESFQPLPGTGIAAGSGGCAPRQGGRACWTVPPWTFSPDAAQLAVARNDTSTVRLVDVERMRVTADIRLDGGPVGALAWLSSRRLLALQEAGSERQRLLTIDLTRRQVMARRALGGSVVRLARTAEELVVLLAPAQAIGSATIAVADRRGAVRSVRLGRIVAGSKLLGTGSEHRVDLRLPGLAVDPQARRAFVVGRELAAEIDLRSLAVSYHELERPASLLGRFRNWLEPAAEAKQMSGHVHAARWLGEGLVAVSGTYVDQTRARPAGLFVVDTRGWSVRMLDRQASSFVVTGNLLLATGTANGLAAYGFDGGNRFRLFDGENTWTAQVYDGRAYVGGSGKETLRIVDLAAGRVVGERRLRLPWLVHGVAAGWWET